MSLYIFVLGHLNNQICKNVEPEYVEEDDSIVIRNQENEKSVVAESTFDKSNKLHTSSGYFNSGESLNSTSKSDILTDKNYDNSLNVTSATDLFHDILNENILSDNCHTEISYNKMTDIYLDESVISSIKPIFENCEDLENVSFPSSNLVDDSEILETNEVKITKENISNWRRNNRSNNSEWMTDISGISSLRTDDFFTCPGTNTDDALYSDSIDTDLLLEDVNACLSITSFSDSMRYLFFKYKFSFKLIIFTLKYTLKCI